MREGRLDMVVFQPISIGEVSIAYATLDVVEEYLNREGGAFEHGLAVLPAFDDRTVRQFHDMDRWIVFDVLDRPNELIQIDMEASLELIQAIAGANPFDQHRDRHSQANEGWLP